MIIGIDETGTFDLASPGASLFVGVHINTIGQRLKLGKDLEAWKGRYPKDKHREIKSWSLTEEMANSFVTEVLKSQEQPHLTVCATLPSEHTKHTIQFHRDHHIKCLNEGIQKCRAVGNNRLAGQYVQLRNWYGKLSYQLLLKTWILGQMIGYSFREHVIQSILDGTDESLGLIQISIDQDFVREPTHIIFWKDLLRSFLYSYTFRNPIPVIKEWRGDHPFFMARELTTTGALVGAFLDEGQVFNNSVNFVRSHESAEVQVADIAAGIIGGFHNRGNFKAAYQEIVPLLIPVREKQRINILRMASSKEARPDVMPDPWDAVARTKNAQVDELPAVGV